MGDGTTIGEEAAGADLAASSTGPAPTAPSGSAALAWLIRTRRGLLTLVASASFILLVSVAAGYAFLDLKLPGEAKSLFAIGSTLVVLPLLLLLLDPTDNLARGPGVALPFATLALLLVLATFAMADRQLGLDLLSVAGSPDRAPFLERVHLLPCVVFFAYLAVALIPRIWNATQFAKAQLEAEASRAKDAVRKLRSTDDAVRSEADKLRARKQENREAEALSALFATVTVGGIVGLAGLASLWRRGEGLLSSVGVGISVGVVGLFAIVIFLDRIAEAPPVRAAGEGLRRLARNFGWLADIYDFIDGLLVRIGAHVAGTEHRRTRTRYTVLAGTMVTLSLMAWFLPAPLGLIPAAVGLILALSVSRLWSWVEEDRNMAAITRFNPDAPRRIGFREDFRDETLLGFIFVLVLIPVAMMQADLGLYNGGLFEAATEEAKRGLGVWLGYFGFELAKALPVVDWADIYNLQPDPNQLKPAAGAGMHAVFIARVMVDLVLIASLLQAIGVATRNRQQKALYAEGHIDRLDELVERQELRRAVLKDEQNWFSGKIDFRRYNIERLKQLHAASTDLREKQFIAEIFRQGGYTLEPAIIILDKISETSRDEGSMHRTFDLVKAEHYSREHNAGAGDLEQILGNLRSTSGLRSLKAEIMTFAVETAPAEEAAEMLRNVMLGPAADAFQYTRKEAARLARELAPQLYDCAFLTSFRDEVVERMDAIFGAARAAPLDLLAALNDRIGQLGCGQGVYLGDFPSDESVGPTQNKP